VAEPVLGVFPVVSARRVGEYHALSFRAPEVAASAAPGRFVSLAPEPGSRCLLRRPFSIYGVRDAAVEVVFDAIGPGTAWLASRRPGDTVDAVGPLGRAFEAPREPGACLLVGGGYGAAPVLFLAPALRAAGCAVHTVVGATRASRLLDEGAAAVSDSLTITTEDGSAGERGLVTDVLPRTAAAHAPAAVYACGPMPMLEAVARWAVAAGIPCAIAVEEFMACGIGVCWTCVLPVRTNGDVKHLRSCSEGPVFDGAAVAWG
jgi:dihydroorotate dehydrogenase electron transfer subunit